MNLLLSLTEKCNLRCSYCYYKLSQIDRELEMSDDILEASLALALERSIKLKHNYLNITFFGGEPLLRMDSIRKGVKLAKSMVKARRSEVPKDFGLRFAVNTNGTLLTDDILDYFKKEKFQIYISLDGPQRKHNISRVYVNGKGCFKEVAPHIPRLVEMDAIALSVITRKHVRGLARSIQWLYEQGFTSMTTSVDFDGKWTGEDFDALALEYQKMAQFWLKLRNRGEKVYIGTIQDKMSYSILGLRQKNCACHIFKGGLGIAANGNVFPCSRFITSNPDAKYILGNVRDSYHRIFTGPVAKEICHFLKYDKPECEGCAIRYCCSAHECGCTSFYTTGSIYGVSPEVCICEETLAKRQILGELV